MRAHEAGVMHAVTRGTGHRGPAWLREPADVSALFPGLWPQNVRRGDDGVLQVAGVAVTDLADQHGTPAYVVDEDDFRARARAFRDEFDTAFRPLCGGAAVYYAAKAFHSVATARWIAEEGLNLDVCTGGELAVALHAGFPAARIAMHGNNKADDELAAALTAGVGRIVVDGWDEIDRLAALAREQDVRPQVLVRVTVGVEAHTHEYIATAHEDQKFGFALAGGAAAAAAGEVLARPELELTGLHSHIGSQIFDTGAFEVAARRVLGLHAQIATEHGVVLPELDLGGGYGIAYTSQDDPLSARQLAEQMAGIVAHEAQVLGVKVPRVSIEPGRAIAGPSTFTLYRAGAIKPVELDAGAQRLYVAVDGGMSDNIRTALYDADYSCTLASRVSDAAPALSRVVGKHCESGDIVVKDEFLPADVSRGDLIAVPGTGAYCRSLANTYNHVPRPPVIAMRDGQARTIVRRETVQDLLAFDVD